MIQSKKIKRTKRELKYIDIIAHLIGLIEGFDAVEISCNTFNMLKDFKLSNYDIKLIYKIFNNLDYYIYRRLR